MKCIFFVLVLDYFFVLVLVVFVFGKLLLAVKLCWLVGGEGLVYYCLMVFFNIVIHMLL